MKIPIKLAMLAVAGLLAGCGGGGFLPGGSHSMNSQRLDLIVRTQSVAQGVPASLVRAVISAESHGDPNAVSRVGAQGLMQLMPGTGAQYGLVNPFDPDSNVAAGTHYLHDLLARYHNNVEFAVAAYNAGPGAVDSYHGVPPYAETRTYVSRVLAAYRSN